MIETRPGDRRLPRLPEAHAMIVKMIGTESEGLFKTGNLSTGGCEFTTTEPVMVGTPLEIMMTIDRKVIRARGRVVYQRPKNKEELSIGVKFTRVGPHDKERLESLIEIERFANRIPVDRCPTVAKAI